MRDKLLTLLLIGSLLLLAGCEQAVEGPPLRIGYMNCNSAAETVQRFSPLTAYISEKLGRPCETIPVDTQDFEERFAAGEFDFVHTNSLLYIILKENQDLELVATEQRGQFGARTAGAIIVRKDSPIKTIADMSGKRMVFGPQLAPTGYLAQYDLMLKAGFDPERELDYYAIPRGSFKHEKLVYAVYFGKYDVAAAPVLDLEVMTRQGKISADDFRILAQSDTIPYCTFGASNKLDPELIASFKSALVELTPQATVQYNGEQVKVLGSAWVDGFESLTDADYDPIREMAKRVNMPPYQEF
ncbi:MAG: phosphate/phosphite/phosphonate ABC transporter substrate-binding protein [Desulfuromonadales bacterium]|nr:phosphate/phosphite/phosphonate ABC transporter substrate-binding protein [Desulfuromonadales bacterium]